MAARRLLGGSPDILSGKGNFMNFGSTSEVLKAWALIKPENYDVKLNEDDEKIAKSDGSSPGSSSGL